MNKIIQIATDSEGNVYGLDEVGLLYVWGSKKISEGHTDTANVYHIPVYVHGWKLQKDEINSPEIINY